jgi:hypothetical protein
MDRLDDNVFKHMFRVDRATFDEILNKIEPIIEHRDEIKAVNSAGAPIHLKTRLAVTLCWLAGASHIDLCFAWGVAHSTFFSARGVLWPTIDAIDEAFSLGFPIGEPSRLEELSKGFSDHSGGLLDGCVLAVDGFGVRTRCPYKSEVEKRKDYRFRKGGFAIIVIAGCDVDARFVCTTATHRGSTNDIIAWQHSHLYRLVELEKRLPENFFFIGEEAFTTTDQMLSPWPGK